MTLNVNIAPGSVDTRDELQNRIYAVDIKDETGKKYATCTWSFNGSGECGARVVFDSPVWRNLSDDVLSDRTKFDDVLSGVVTNFMNDLMKVIEQGGGKVPALPRDVRKLTIQLELAGAFISSSPSANNIKQTEVDGCIVASCGSSANMAIGEYLRSSSRPDLHSTLVVYVGVHSNPIEVCRYEVDRYSAIPSIPWRNILWLVIPAVVLFATLVLISPLGGAVIAVAPVAVNPYVILAAASVAGSMLLTAARYALSTLLDLVIVPKLPLVPYVQSREDTVGNLAFRAQLQHQPPDQLQLQPSSQGNILIQSDDNTTFL